MSEPRVNFGSTRPHRLNRLLRIVHLLGFLDVEIDVLEEGCGRVFGFVPFLRGEWDYVLIIVRDLRDC